jgi:hypothetical protein
MKQFFKENFGKLKDIVSNNFEKENIYSTQIQSIIKTFRKYNSETIKDEIIESKYFDNSYNLPNENNGFLFLAIVSFHQKHGSLVECTYPSREIILKEHNEFLTSFIEGKTAEQNLDEIFYKLSIYCLADGIHLTNRDNEIFFIQSEKKVLYCTSTYRQIKTNIKDVQDDFQENIRDCIQKSLCIVSIKPNFSYFYDKINKTLDLFMAQDTLNDKQIIESSFENFHNEESTLTFSSYEDFLIKFFNYRKLFKFLLDDVFKIIKLILLEKKIIVFSKLPSNGSLFIISTITLFPGLFSYSQKESIEKNNYEKFLNQTGFPLKLFHNKYVLFPIFTLFDMDKITKDKVDSYIICSSNPLLLQSKEVKWDCLINLDDKEIIYKDDIPEYILEVKSFEKAMINKIVELIKSNEKVEEKYYEKKKDNIDILKYFSNKRELKGEWIVFDYLCKNLLESDKDFNFNTELYETICSENRFIKEQFSEYFLSLFYDLSLAKKKVINKTDLNSIIISSHPLMNNNNQNKNFGILPTLEEYCSEPSIYHLSKIFKNHNILFILKYIETENFKIWFKEHNEIISYLSEYSEPINKIEIYYENGDNYNGGMKRGKKSGFGNLIMVKSKFSYIGNWKNGKKHGKGNYSSTNENKYLYEGDWLNDEMDGNGSLITEYEKYVGHFKKGKFDGEGCLVDNKGNIYNGSFKNGIKEGKGTLQLINGDFYDGEFINGNYNGKGKLIKKNENIVLEGIFLNGKFIEENSNDNNKK